MGVGGGAASAHSSLELWGPWLVVGVLRVIAGGVRREVVGVGWTGEVVGVGAFVAVVVLEVVVALTRCFCRRRLSFSCRILCRSLIFWRWVVFVVVCLFVLLFVVLFLPLLLLSLLLLRIIESSLLLVVIVG